MLGLKKPNETFRFLAIHEKEILILIHLVHVLRRQARMGWTPNLNFSIMKVILFKAEYTNTSKKTQWVVLLSRKYLFVFIESAEFHLQQHTGLGWSLLSMIQAFYR